MYSVIDIKPGIILLNNRFEATLYIIECAGEPPLYRTEHKIVWSDLSVSTYIKPTGGTLMDAELYTDIFI